MASQSLGTLTYDLIAKIGGFTSGMTEAERQAKKSADAINTQIVAIGTAAGNVGTKIGQQIADGIKFAANAIPELIDSVGAFQDIADKTGGSAAGFAAFAVSAKTADVSIESIASSSARLSKALLDAGDASKPITAGLSALNVNLGDLKKQTPDQQIKTIANAFGNFADGANKAAVAQQIFGRSGADLLKFFKDYTDNGGDVNILTDQMISQADDYTDAQKRLRAEVEQFLGAASTYFIEPLTILKQLLVDTAKEVLGADGSFNQLAANQAVQTFAENVGRSLAQAIDYVRQSVKEFQVLTDFVTQSAKALNQVAQFDFAGAAKTGSDFRSKYGLDELGRKVSQGSAEIGGAAAKSFTSSYDAQLARNKADRNRAALNAVNYGTGGDNRPQLPATTPAKKGGGDGGAGALARAQLGADLDAIKNIQKAQQDAISNSQKLLEAAHSAGLTDDQQYYDKRKQFLDADTKAQTDSLNAQIARLQQESFSGKSAAKDAVDNQKKIADARAQLTKVQADAATQGQILGIQEESSLRKVASALLAARQAAQDYFDTTNKGYERTLAGIGQGSKTRDFLSGLGQIEDKYQQQRQQLQDQRSQAQLLGGGTLTPQAAKQFDDQLSIINEFQAKAVDSYKAYYAKIDAAQTDWLNGAKEALANYIDSVNDASKRAQDLITTGLGGITDSITGLLTGDKSLSSFKDLGKKMADQIIKGIVEQQITKPLAQWLQGSLKDPDSIIGKFLGGVTSTKGTGENWLGGLLGLKGGAGSSAASTASAATATTSLATAATSAATALSSLATAAGGSSGSGGGGLFGSLFGSGGGFGQAAALAGANAVGASGGDALGAFIGLSGFASGGFTGVGASNDPAGFVHKNEYVLNSAQTQKIGVANLDRGNFGGGTVVNINQSFAPGSTRQTTDQAAMAAGNVARRATARNG